MLFRSQNIPIRTKSGRLIRRAFIPKRGFKLVSFDYSQIELRLLAHLGNIEKLKNIFIRNEDIHQKTASEIFSLPLNEIDTEMRRKAKSINFGILYGISAFRLSHQLGIACFEAETYINSYFQYYPGIKQYIEEIKKSAYEDGFVTTLMGRRCYIPKMQDRKVYIRASAERQAVNAPFQGSSADITKLAMIQLENLIQTHKFSARLLLQIHDELIFEVPDVEQSDHMIASLQHEMAHVVQLSVPLVVNVHQGYNWQDI